MFFVCLSYLIVIFDNGSAAPNSLVEEFSWKEIDFNFGDASDRKLAISNEVYIPGKTIPTSIEIWGERMFIATPRLNGGVPSTLNYISITDVNTKSPTLNPYPSWEMNNSMNKSSNKVKMTSIYSICADACNRLWALDTGVVDEASNRKVESPPMIFIFSLADHTLLRKHTLQETEYEATSRFRNIAVDVTSSTCENAHAYLADSRLGLIVYSWLANKSFRVTHNYFSFDPIWGNFKTSAGRDIQLNEGLFGMALTIPKQNGYRDLLFHPMIGTNEFRVSTQLLQNKTLAKANFTSFYLLGNRGVNTQSTASFMDIENGLLYYTTLIKNGVSCWNYYKGEEFSPENQGTIAEFPHKKAFPYDLKVDKNGTLWVLTNRLLDMVYDHSEENTPFRIYSGVVKKIIRGTPCEEI